MVITYWRLLGIHLWNNGKPDVARYKTQSISESQFNPFSANRSNHVINVNKKNVEHQFSNDWCSIRMWKLPKYDLKKKIITLQDGQEIHWYKRPTICPNETFRNILENQILRQYFEPVSSPLDSLDTFRPQV